MDYLRISTITCVLMISEEINLEKIYKTIPISKYISFIEFGDDNTPKGFSEKAQKKKRKKKKKKIFYNQATMHVFYDSKIMNVKLFNNGRIQITGLKKEDQGEPLIKGLIDYLSDFCIFENDVDIISSKIVLINSDFDMGYQIIREKLQIEIVKYGLYSTLETCIYPGVNIKYYINTNNCDGICCCSKMCNGKGDANGNGDCKKVTIAVFKSGKIIITGAQNKTQLETCYRFIKNFIEDKKDEFILNEKSKTICC